MTCFWFFESSFRNKLYPFVVSIFCMLYITGWELNGMRKVSAHGNSWSFSLLTINGNSWTEDGYREARVVLIAAL